MLLSGWLLQSSKSLVFMFYVQVQNWSRYEISDIKVFEKLHVNIWTSYLIEVIYKNTNLLYCFHEPLTLF